MPAADAAKAYSASTRTYATRSRNSHYPPDLLSHAYNVARMILLVSRSFPPMRGGSGRWLWGTVRRMPRESVHAATSLTPEGEAFDRTHDLPMSASTAATAELERAQPAAAAWATCPLCGQLRRLVRQTRPAVIHCGKCLPEGFPAWALRASGGPPYWCYAHGEELTLARTSAELGWLTRRALRGAAGIIANSQHTRGLLVRDWGVKPERIHVLHPGVDAHAFVPAEPDPAVRAKLGWTDRRVILTVGAFNSAVSRT